MRPGSGSPAPAALIRRLEWRLRSAVSTSLSGGYRSTFRGRGMEFDQVVEYQWGDDQRDIDWKVTARRGEPYRKRFVEERELAVIVVFEDSPSLQFGSEGRTRRQTLLEIASLLMLLAGINRDRVSLLYSAPTGAWLHRATPGRRGVLRLAARLLEQPQPGLDGPVVCEPRWQLVRRLGASGSVLVWLGPFSPGPRPPSWRELQGRYRTVGIRADDPWDSGLPRGLKFAAYDPLAGRITSIDTSALAQRRAHARWQAQREAHFCKLFPLPADRLVVGGTDDPLQALVGFFRGQASGGAGSVVR